MDSLMATTSKTAAVTDYFSLGADIADTKAPAGPIEKKWSQRKFGAKLVNPANRRKLTVIIVGTGLAGGAAAASLGGAGYNVLNLDRKSVV
jgi:succinate dehydrogenase / fumarate reductase flavoprotein subunit